MRIIGRGTIQDRDGQRYFKLDMPKTFQRGLWVFPVGEVVEVEVRQPRKDRTNQQNSYYWGVVVDMVSKELGYEPHEMHEEFKRMFNPQPSKIDPEVTFGGSTTKLTTTEMNEYIERIARWAAGYLGIVIPDPTEAG